MINTEKLSVQCYKEIRRKILFKKKFQPQDRIYEKELAEEMGVSRTPIREALIQLEEEGIVSIEPRKGIYVRKIPIKELLDIYDTRIALEQLVIEKSRNNITKKDITELKGYNKDYAAAMGKEDVVKCLEADNRFHKKLISMSDSKIIKDIINKYSLQVQAITANNENYFLMADTYYKQHKNIILYLKKGALKKAKEEVEKHIKTGKECLQNNYKVKSCS